MPSPPKENPSSLAEGDQVVKKRQRVRACDQCRRRKVKCGPGEIQGPKCSNCVILKNECTYLAGTDTRFCDVDYVRSLEIEVSNLKQLVRKLQIELATRTSGCTSSEAAPSLETTRSSTPRVPMSIRLTPDVEESLDDAGEDDGQEILVEELRSLNVNSPHNHFVGRSSTLMLIRTALDMKQEFVGGVKSTQTETPQGRSLPFRRPEFWEVADMLNQPEPPYSDFPDHFIMAELIELFFRHMNVMLYRSGFERDIRSGLHLRDEGFGATVLLVCANGSRFSNNPVVLMDRSKNWHWAGWRWFSQVRERRKFISMRATTLYDVQVAWLSAAYVAASAAPHSTYAIVGHGLRLLQDLGAHRRTTYGPVPTVESEQKKRAFWCLVAMDRGMCSLLGRPCTFHDEDIDVDFPIECDEEYWEPDDPTMAFKQPPGKPSTTAFFNCCLRLNGIHAFALRTIYSLKAAKLMADPRRAQEVVAEIDSRLNSFIDSIPEHLKWDPHQPNILWASQSAILHAFYYQTQIAVHRPFIPTARKSSPLTFPSLAICTNAARSCIHVLDRQYQRIGATLFHHWHQMPLFTSAIVLLLNIWSSRRLGSTVDTAKEMEEIGKVLRMLADLEPRWNTAGRFADILRDLASDAGQPTRTLQPQPHKRRRDDTNSCPALEPVVNIHPSGLIEQRSIAGSKRAEQCQQSTFVESAATSHSFNFDFDFDFDFSLPIHSEDLGRIPVASFEYNAAASDTRSSVDNASFSLDSSLLNVLAASTTPSQIGDPELDAIFNGLFPGANYDETFAALAQGGSEYANQVSDGGPPVGPSTSLSSSEPYPIPAAFITPSHFGPHPSFQQGAHGTPSY